MPFMTNGKRDYKRELANEKKHGKKRQNERVARNKARREVGLKVGDPRQADHKKPLVDGGSTNKSNVRIVSAKTNAMKEVARKKRVAK